MTDIYDQAGTQIDTDKRNMLAAAAQAGSAGVAAYQQAQVAIQQQQQVAVQAALASAAQRNAPQALQNELTAQINAPYDRYRADLSAAQAYGTASNANLQAANAAYFDQARAAIPALRTYSQAQAAERAAKAAKESGSDLSFLGALNKQFGSVSGGNRALLADARNYVNEHGGNFGHAGTSALLARYDAEHGLPEGYTRALLKPATGQPKAVKATQGQQRTRTLNSVSKKHGADSNTFKAFSFIVSQASNLASAMNALNDPEAQQHLVTPNGKPLNKTRLRTYLRSYYANG